MGVSAGLTATTLPSVTDPTSPGVPTSSAPLAPPYKMEPTDTSMYYQGLPEGAEHQAQPTSVFQVRIMANPPYYSR